MKYLLLLTLLILPSAKSFAVEGDYCNTADNTIELNRCGYIYWKREDAALQIIYDDAIEELKTKDNESPLIGPIRTGSREKKFREAQQAWMKFSNLHCQSKALIVGSGGSISGQIQYDCRREITKERALEIQKLLNISWVN